MIIQSQEEINAALLATQVQDVWGVGRALTTRLKRLGFFSGIDLAKIDPRLARQKSTVVGERLVRELQGLSCLDLQEENSIGKAFRLHGVLVFLSLNMMIFHKQSLYTLLHLEKNYANIT